MFGFKKVKKKAVQAKQSVSYDFGTVDYTRSSRSRRISIRVRPMGKISVSFPARESLKNAELFVLDKRDWIMESMTKMAKIANLNTIFDEHTDFSTRFHKLKISAESRENIKAKIGKGLIDVRYPMEASVTDASVQAGIRKAIEATLRLEAKEFLPQRVSILAQKHDFQYNEVVIRNNKSVWGSCSSRKKISLSLHLMRLPDHLIDYIILHELSHTREANHGPGFWQLLDKVSGNAKGLDNEMKKYHLKYY
jgi:predicted metal-dependent hydrolase